MSRVKLIGILLLSFVVCGAMAQNSFFNTDTKTDKPTIEWDNMVYDFGDVKMGEKATYKFEFKNTSLKPVIIQKVEVSCDCTSADYSKHPIKPGEKGTITVIYDADKTGAFFKSITVTANTKNSQHILKMTGVVVD